MPRNYGITNVAPYASAPTVGNAGDEYWNSATKTLYISDGTQWNPSGGAPYAPVSNGVAPPAAAPTVTPPMGLLWVDTSITSASFIGPSGQPDGGVVSGAADLNTYQTSGVYAFTGTVTNGPSNFVANGPYILEVNSVGNGTYILQQITLATSTGYVATRIYTGGSWGGWSTPVGMKPVFGFTAHPGTATSGTTALTVATLSIAAVPYAQRVRMEAMTGVNLSVATDTFQVNLASNYLGTGRIMRWTPGHTGMYETYLSDAYVLPANTADTLTTTVTRISGTGTGTCATDARFSYSSYEAWPVTS